MKIFFLIICLIPAMAMAQFAPQALLPGSDAVHYDDGRIKDWASGCILQRGWKDIAQKDSGYTTAGDSTSAIGAYNASLVSLGDSGVAVLTFNHPVINGEGPDFAVFENGFANPLNDTLAYLELAFVEVSSDGIHYTRFPATCNIQDTAQIDNFTYSDASFINNLAGKYIAGYGTPFDLDELKDIPGLDVNNITHIRIVDVIGSISPQYASYDKNDHIINDAYPTLYPTGGFDLNAVAVLNNNAATAVNNIGTEAALIYPNPVKEILHLIMKEEGRYSYMLTDITGRSIATGNFKKETAIDCTHKAPGFYFLQVRKGQNITTYKLNKL